ncbi:flagellar assembly protein FliW [Nocardioides caeni]|nr:flagellar assembly protein FliW [Nocardioides caeni]
MDVTDAGAGAEGIPVIELVHPMPGFPDDARFALVRLDEEGMLHGFRSLDHDDLQFIVVPPSAFYPDYAPEIADDVVADLGIDRVEDVMVLLVVRAGADLADTTVNLRAPLLVNTATRRASQVILDDQDLPLAAPLVA